MLVGIMVSAFIAASTLGALNCDVNGVSEKGCFDTLTIEYSYPSSK